MTDPQTIVEGMTMAPSNWRFDFWGSDIVSERRRVRAMFEAEGFSIGRRQRGAPSGILLGEFDIQKWRNLRKADIADLHGKLFEDAFPIRALFIAEIGSDLNEALHRVNQRDAVRTHLEKESKK